MKKTIITLTLVLVLAMCCPMVLAATGDFAVELDEKTAAPGETATLTVTVTENPGVAFLTLTASYDDTALELVSAENGTIISDFERGANLLWSADDNSTATGTLVTLTFKVRNTAANGKYPVTLTVRECYNYDFDDVTVNVTEGAVIVEGGQAHVHEDADGKWEKDDANHWHTCACNEKFDTAAHTYGAWTTTKPATATAGGEKERTCSDCGYVQTGTIPPVAPTPSTGDQFPLMTTVIVMMTSLVLLGGMIFLLKKKNA